MRLALLLLGFTAAAAIRAESPDASDWGYYGGDMYGQRFSNLAEIHRANVGELREAWRYRDVEPGATAKAAAGTVSGATPVLAFDTLYFSMPSGTVVALDPANGHARWRYDPASQLKASNMPMGSRGVSLWEDPTGTSACPRRVFLLTLDARLMALDAATGKACASFGHSGVVYLSQDYRDDRLFVTPPLSYNDWVIVASSGGRVRAFDAKSGAASWTLETGLALHATLSVDPDRGALFVAAANSVLGVEAASGKLLWKRELVHRDLWGLTLKAQPLLIDLELADRVSSAIIEATSTGALFVLDRQSGSPIFPIVEQRVPGSNSGTMPSSPTQPFPTTPMLLNPQPINARDIWGLTFWDRAQCRASLASHRNEGILTPPEPRGSILPSGRDGGVGWGSLAFDPRRGRIFAAVDHLAVIASPPDREQPWVSPWGYPCTSPPWGTLVSVDLRSNRIVWQVPLGSTRGFGPHFMPTRNFGTPNRGGPIATAGDLIFVAAAMDEFLRAFDLETGRELWKTKLHGSGHATPMTYRAGPHHHQYLAIVTGGQELIAFTLPQKPH